jgi:hypothetical protein
MSALIPDPLIENKLYLWLHPTLEGHRQKALI